VVTADPSSAFVYPNGAACAPCQPPAHGAGGWPATRPSAQRPSVHRSPQPRSPYVLRLGPSAWCARISESPSPAKLWPPEASAVSFRRAVQSAHRICASNRSMARTVVVNADLEPLRQLRHLRGIAHRAGCSGSSAVTCIRPVPRPIRVRLAYPVAIVTAGASGHQISRNESCRDLPSCRSTKS
jgi:hypothetical protein